MTMVRRGHVWIPAPATDRTLALDPAAVQARLAICGACPHHRPASNRCGMMSCGCPLTARAARPWARCPDTRWPT